MAGKKKKKAGVSMTAFAAITTYSDLMSLLLTVFVLLFALSEPKRPKLAATMNAIRQVMLGLPPAPAPKPAVKPQQVSQNELNTLRRGPPGKRSEVSTIIEEGRQKMVIGGDEFFLPGSADLSPRAQRILQHDIAPDLRGFNNRVEITGHTEKTANQAENTWNLGFQRAEAAMRYLVDECGIPEARFRLSSSSNNEPRDPYKPAANRRVEIVMTDHLVRLPGEDDKPE